MNDFYYFDSDACLKILIPEVGHQQCRSIYENPQNTILISEFSILEVTSAIRVIRDQGEISQRVFDETLRHFNSIILGNTGHAVAQIMVIPLSNDHLNNAQILISTEKLRPGDSIQMAVAMQIRAMDPIVTSGDRKVLGVASKSRLKTMNVNKCICPSCRSIIQVTFQTVQCQHCGASKTTVDEAKCQCGYVCTLCSNPKWCEKIRNSQIA